jgi:hypothetical protein
VSAGGFATVADRRYNIQHVQRPAAFLHRKFFERFDALEFFPHFIRWNDDGLLAGRDVPAK